MSVTQSIDSRPVDLSYSFSTIFIALNRFMVIVCTCMCVFIFPSSSLLSLSFLSVCLSVSLSHLYKYFKNCFARERGREGGRGRVKLKVIAEYQITINYYYNSHTLQISLQLAEHRLRVIFLSVSTQLK